MLNLGSKNNLADRIGIFFTVASLVLYFLLKLPFNLSVACSSANEGFYFIFGQYFQASYPNASGFLFVLFYSIVLKILGFNIWSLIFFHFFQTLLMISTAIILYLLTRQILLSNFFSGLVVLFWILIQITPIGCWGQKLECTSSFSLDAEYFCIFFSISSFYCLALSLKVNSANKLKNRALSVLSGIFAGFSMLFKASGTILVIAVVCWLVYLFLLNRKLLYDIKYNLLFFFIGLTSSILFFSIIIFFIYGDLFTYWKNYYTVGSYTKEFFKTPRSLALYLLGFMTKFTFSLSNFTLFLCAFLCFAWGLIRIFFIRKPKSQHEIFISLLSLWSIGSVCVVIAAGEYSSYYYTLVWPSVAFFLVLGIRDLLFYAKILDKKIFKIIITFTIIIFFTQRLITVIPTYVDLIKKSTYLNIVFQRESFKDPIKLTSLNKNPNRKGVLKIADLINYFLPDKSDRFYVLNFTEGHTNLGPNIYIYAKRLPPTTIVSDFLHYPKYINRVINNLIKELKYNPPKLLLIPADIHKPTQVGESIAPFFEWFSIFLKENYHKKFSFNYKFSNMKEAQTYFIFERN